MKKVMRKRSLVTIYQLGQSGLNPSKLTNVIQIPTGNCCPIPPGNFRPNWSYAGNANNCYYFGAWCAITRPPMALLTSVPILNQIQYFMPRKKPGPKTTRQGSVIDYPIPIPKKHQNKLFYGDNLEILRRYIKDESVNLCYIDPPFNSKRNYNQIYNNIGKEDKAQAQAFVDTWTWDEEAVLGFKQITENFNSVFTKQAIELIVGLRKVLGEGDLMAYLISMTLRIAEIYRVLKPTGSFYLHCDPTASHYLKLVMDSIFCAQGGDFRNEIIWHYKRWPAKQSNFQQMHDVILFYTKEARGNIFNIEYEELSEGTLKRWRGKKSKVEFDGDVRLVTKMTDENSIGRPADDVWDIPVINSQAKERLGYPTQKPEALIERIIKASSNEGDVILDAYCGCGTTVAVAEKLDRKWIGIDITYQSISLILKRLEKHFGGQIISDIDLNGVPEDFESAVMLANKRDDRTRKEFEKWAVLTFSNNRAIINEKKGADGGIDGVAYFLDFNNKREQDYRKIIFSVKSNKSLPVSVIRELNGTIEREGAAMGILLTLYKMENLVKESKRYGTYTNVMLDQTHPKIQVISIEEMLSGKRMKIPTSLDVGKDAEPKSKSKQQRLDF